MTVINAVATTIAAAVVMNVDVALRDTVNVGVGVDIFVVLAASAHCDCDR